MVFPNVTKKYFKNTHTKSTPIILSEDLKIVLEASDTNNKFVKRLLQNTPIKSTYLQEDHANFLDLDSDEEGNVLVSYTTKPLILKKVSRRSTNPEELNISLHDYEVFNFHNSKSIVRESTKPGRLVTKLFDKYTNTEIEEFSTVLSSSVVSDKLLAAFSEVSGDAIYYYYNAKSYTQIDVTTGASTLHNSCMRYPVIQSYMELYCKNPDQISMLICKDKYGKIKGRAIIWKVDSKKYIDRIYYDSFSTYTRFIKYCKINNIINISPKNASFLVGVDLNTFKVKLTNWLFQYYPYTDTLVCLSVQDGTLAASKPDIVYKSVSPELVKTLLPSTVTEEEYKNTYLLLRDAEEIYGTSSLSITDMQSSVLMIQSTGGKGSGIIKKTTTLSTRLVRLDPIYKAYYLFDCCSTAENMQGLSPKSDVSSKMIVNNEEERVGTVILNYKYNTKQGTYVNTVLIDSYGILKVIMPEQDNVPYCSHRDNAVPSFLFKEDSVYLPKRSSIQLDSNIINSYVPFKYHENANMRFLLKQKLEYENTVDKTLYSTTVLNEESVSKMLYLMYGTYFLLQQDSLKVIKSTERSLFIRNMHSTIGSSNYRVITSFLWFLLYYKEKRVSYISYTSERLIPVAPFMFAKTTPKLPEHA